MITRVHSDVVWEMMDVMSRRCVWLGLLEWPPSAFASTTEARAAGYSRQQVTWTRKASGLLTQSAPLSFAGLDSPSMVSALGLFRDASAGAMMAWGPLPEPLRVLKGTVTIAAGTVSLRIG